MNKKKKKKLDERKKEKKKFFSIRIRVRIVTGQVNRRFFVRRGSRWKKDWQARIERLEPLKFSAAIGSRL